MSYYTIIGNSAAAIGAMEAIRQLDRENPITVISDEPYLAYSRPLISYLLAGIVNEDKMPLRDEQFYSRNGIEALLGRQATRVIPDRKTVELAGGDKVPYEKLLVACGGRPIIPDLPGRELKGVFTFTTWDETKAILDFIQKERVSNALVLGGGLIGLKTTEALIERDIKVTVVELADRVLSATFDKKASAIMADALHKAGCQLLTDSTLSEIRGKKGKISGALLKDGTELECDLLILAIGVAPNTSLVKDSGIRLDRGILVNGKMQTNVPDVYAAGDVAQAYDLLSGLNRTIAIWPLALQQGRVAGFNMAGSAKEYDGSLAMNAVEICDVPTISVGLTDPPSDEYEILQKWDDRKGSYKKIVLKDNIVVGSIFIGDIGRAGIVTGLLKDRTDVALFKDKLLREDFGLVWLPKDYRKHLVEGPGVEV